eukprot:gene9546-biopygen3341
MLMAVEGMAFCMEAMNAHGGDKPRSPSGRAPLVASGWGAAWHEWPGGTASVCGPGRTSQLRTQPLLTSSARPSDRYKKKPEKETEVKYNGGICVCDGQIGWLGGRIGWLGITHWLDGETESADSPTAAAHPLRRRNRQWAAAARSVRTLPVPHSVPCSAEEDARDARAIPRYPRTRPRRRRRRRGRSPAGGKGGPALPAGGTAGSSDPLRKFSRDTRQDGHPPDHCPGDDTQYRVVQMAGILYTSVPNNTLERLAGRHLRVGFVIGIVEVLPGRGQLVGRWRRRDEWHNARDQTAPPRVARVRVPLALPPLARALVEASYSCAH